MRAYAPRALVLPPPRSTPDAYSTFSPSATAPSPPERPFLHRMDSRPSNLGVSMGLIPPIPAARPTGHSLVSENAAEIRRARARQQITGRESDRERDEGSIDVDMEMAMDIDTDTNREWAAEADRRRSRLSIIRRHNASLAERLGRSNAGSRTAATPEPATSGRIGPDAWLPRPSPTVTSPPSQDVSTGGRPQGESRLPPSSSEAGAPFIAAASSPASLTLARRLSQPAPQMVPAVRRLADAPDAVRSPTHAPRDRGRDTPPTLPSLAESLTSDPMRLIPEIWDSVFDLNSAIDPPGHLHARADLRASLEPMSAFRSRSPSPARVSGPAQSESVSSSARAAGRDEGVSQGEVLGRSAAGVRANINPDAYHDGPFRTTIGRILEMEQQTTEETRREQVGLDRSSSSQPHRREGMDESFARVASPVSQATTSGVDTSMNR
jgi:hypothetical protein